MLFQIIAAWWRKRQRAIDISILWPECKRQANDIHEARWAFSVHCKMDRAWTADMTAQEIDFTIMELS